MARFNTSGLDDTIARMKSLGILGSEVADRMLLAGAEKVKEAWKQAAGLHGLKQTGDMIESIGFARKPKNVNGIRTLDIYPQGKDRKGVRNAEKAFILHYGTHSAASISRGQRKALRKGKKYRQPGIPATHWVDDADQLAEEPAIEAMEQVFDKYLKEKGLI